MATPSFVDEIINNHFSVVSTSYQPVRGKDGFPMFIPVYEIIKRSDLSQQMKQAMQELEQVGYIALLRDHPDLPESRVYLILREFKTKGSTTTRSFSYALPLSLFVATVASVLFFGFMSFSESFGFIDVILYAVGIMGIISIHELGHMLASRSHKIKASLPYFIPMPIFLGTMGAFINQRSPLTDRDALFDLGISGPIAGLIVSLIAVVVGVMISPAIPLSDIPQGAEPINDVMGFGILIFDILVTIFANLRAVPENYTLLIHPLCFAGWVGLVITGLNLLPVGQLDGGHIARSLLNQKVHRVVTYVMAFVMILIGFFFMAMLILFFYMWAGHPGPLDDVGEVSKSRKIIGIATFAFAVICVPIPTNIYNLIISFIL